MSRIAYVNGRYRPLADAAVHIEDRGFLFADGVYEVCEVRDGHIIDETRHVERLKRSMRELRMSAPVGEGAFRFILREVIRRNHVVDGMVYVQVTRGAAKRDFVFPSPAVQPTLVVVARPIDRRRGDDLASDGIAVVTHPDNRWERVDIKSVSLLPNVLARQAAKERGAREAWLHDEEGFVTEGAASNAWIVTGEGTLVTRPAENGILRGVTRTTLFDLAAAEGLAIAERPFTVDEAKAAREAFVTAATTLVMPVIRIDDVVIGDGRPGPLVRRLRAEFHRFAEHAA